MFTRKGTRYNLRRSDFEIPRFDTIRYCKHTLRYQGPYIWSKLENSMRELPSVSIFKTNIRRVDMASLVEDMQWQLLQSLQHVIIYNYLHCTSIFYVI